MSMWRADSMPNFFSISWNMSEAESKVPFSSLASTETEMKSTKLATFIKSHQRFVCMCVCVCACMCASMCVCLCVHLGLGVCLWVGVCLIYCASHGVCVWKCMVFFSVRKPCCVNRHVLAWIKNIFKNCTHKNHHSFSHWSMGCTGVWVTL